MSIDISIALYVLTGLCTIIGFLVRSSYRSLCDEIQLLRKVVGDIHIAHAKVEQDVKLLPCRQPGKTPCVR